MLINCSNILGDVRLTLW